MHERSALTARAAVLAAVAGLVALCAWRHGPLLRGLDTHLADFPALHGRSLLTEAADTRLNAWILDWVQHTALRDPGGLLDTNAFHPARGTLTGSEHLIGVALPLLPVRGLVGGAVALHQTALVLSALLLALTSFAAVRGWTGSVPGGLVAGAAALMMPWRVTEISHLQLASVQWFPLVWWLLLRAIERDVAPGERIALGGAVALQLLSSFYLAYFLTFSCGVLLLFGLRDARRRRRLPAIAASLVPGYALLAASALPYLARRQAADLAPGYDPGFAVGLERAWSLLHPRVPGWLAGAPPGPLVPDPAYDLPWGVALLAVVAALAAAARSSRGSEARVAVAALWGVALVGSVLALGGSVDLLGLRVPLPTRWLAALLPGFEMLRGPVRWLILTGVAMALLAGLGAAAIEQHTRGVARGLALAGTVALLGLGLDWFAIPSRAAWAPDAPELVERRYAALAALPPGPVVEVPFTRPLEDEELGSRAMLASTLHRRPIVNGYTGYPPPSHALFLRIGARLPERDAILALGRLAGVRYFVVDHRDTRAGAIEAWAHHAAQGLVTLRFGDPTHRIYELRASAASGAGSAALRAARPGPETLGGLPRLPVSPAPGSVGFEARIPERLDAGVPSPLAVRIANASDVAWPGLDVAHEGLVMVRYTWRAAGDATPLRSGVLPFDRDLAPGARLATQLWLRAPLAAGPHELCLDLVHQQAGEWIGLGGPAVAQRVEIVRPPGILELHDLIEAYTLPGPRRGPCTSGRGDGA